MESVIGPMLPLFERERAASRALAFGVVIGTVGSTYRKPGALMVIAANGDYAGLLSGGCLEADLREHARTVMESGQARTVSYDLSDPKDVLWGVGAGCEGAMEILLARVGRENDWQPLAHLADSLVAHRPTAVRIVTASRDPQWPPGTIILPDMPAASGDADVFILTLTLPPRVLLLGGGPDAVPVVDIAARLGWKLTVVDHRPAYAKQSNFPAAERVLLAHPDKLPGMVDFSHYAAAVIMSHHLLSDLAYLRAISDSQIPYVGLLGPAVRRERLLDELGAQGQALHARLRAPVGLALGGRTPESIALAIVAEIHAFLHGASGGPFGVRP
jgi:xanthine dehydrogenase accessory factor